MRVSSPTSKTRIAPLLTTFDVGWACAAPVIALLIRQPNLADTGYASAAAIELYEYVLLTVACSIFSIMLFRLGDSMTGFFSDRDLWSIGGAACFASSLSAGITFTFTRMNSIPRSTPLILAFLLFAGFCIGRLMATLATSNENYRAALPAANSVRRVLLVGVDRFSSQVVRLIEEQAPRVVQIVAILDDSLRGRSINGARVVGGPNDLTAVIEEYAVHGVEIAEVWICDSLIVNLALVDQIRERCTGFGVSCRSVCAALNLEPSVSNGGDLQTPQTLAPPAQFVIKRAIDVSVAAMLLMVLAPVCLVMTFLVYLDVGAPALFWQERLGRDGRRFLLYKFRTYKAPFDAKGREIPASGRLSRIGRAIRATRMDEIPQLLNVLRGDMSLIGPRPLLPIDQPADPKMRLSVRPGLTGWAQVNGGVLLSPEEKNTLDSWYIKHLSIVLDLLIAWRTLCYFFEGERRDSRADKTAARWRQSPRGREALQSPRRIYSRAPTKPIELDITSARVAAE